MHKSKALLLSTILFLLLSRAAGGFSQEQQSIPLRFVVLGNTGTAGPEQNAIAKQLEAFWDSFRFQFGIMVGDNLYGSEDAKDFAQNFEKPYKALLQRGVNFFLALGNHDDPEIQKVSKPLNMAAERYYSFKPRNGVRFFALDSNYMDKKQLAWIDRQLAASGSDWKILFFHHPMYSSGENHASNIELRSVLEPLINKHGVDVVFNGHEHFYQRMKPYKTVHYFSVGSSSKLQRGDMLKTDITAQSFDHDHLFLLAEIRDDEMKFMAITRLGKVVDQGTIRRVERQKSVTNSP